MSYLSLIVAVVATFAGYNIYQSQRVESIMSDLTMANVEALAGSEINDEDCVSASNRYCSVLIVTPNGNYLETYLTKNKVLILIKSGDRNISFD